MVRITVESPSGKRRFAFEFVVVAQARKLLEILDTQGFEAAEQYVQRIGKNPCRTCGRPDKPYHTPGKHPFIPLANQRKPLGASWRKEKV